MACVLKRSEKPGINWKHILNKNTLNSDVWGWTLWNYLSTEKALCHLKVDGYRSLQKKGAKNSKCHLSVHTSLLFLPPSFSPLQSCREPRSRSPYPFGHPRPSFQCWNAPSVSAERWNVTPMFPMWVVSGRSYNQNPLELSLKKCCVQICSSHLSCQYPYHPWHHVCCISHAFILIFRVNVGKYTIDGCYGIVHNDTPRWVGVNPHFPGSGLSASGRL